LIFNAFFFKSFIASRFTFIVSVSFSRSPIICRNIKAKEETCKNDQPRLSLSLSPYDIQFGMVEAVDERTEAVDRLQSQRDE
jgi:hypothetical protein